jgi:hypothetical protein
MTEDDYHGNDGPWRPEMVEAALRARLEAIGDIARNDALGVMTRMRMIRELLEGASVRETATAR